MRDLIQRLEQITEEIIFSGGEYGRQYTACHELYDLFSEITGISDLSKNPYDEIETLLPDGKAISAKNAARCVLDFARTTKFLQGIYSAVLEAKRRFPNDRIEILYAGCGPYATLAIPLCTKFEDSEISFTLLDYHAVSINSARMLFQVLELQNFAEHFIQTDAVRYQSGKKFHIIITETMQKSLEKEPQVAITLNLAPQLCENGIFIPQKITVDVMLADLGKEFSSEPKRIKLANILELTHKTKSLPNVSVEIPRNDLSLILSTNIKVFDSFDLIDYNSGITYPTVLHEFNALERSAKLEFRYSQGKEPQFRYKEI